MERPKDQKGRVLERSPSETLALPQSLETKIADQDSLLLTYDNLKVFLGGPEGPPRRGNYRAAEFLYYGVHDLERLQGSVRDGLPEEFYQATTAAERAAFFIGNARLKYDPHAEMQAIRRQQELSQMPTPMLVSLLVQIGWGYQAVRKLQETVDNGYKRERNGLIKAIEALPAEVQDRVKSQVLRKRVVSSRMNKHYNDFPDTNPEGRVDYTSANNYIAGAASHLKLVQKAMPLPK